MSVSCETCRCASGVVARERGVLPHTRPASGGSGSEPSDGGSPLERPRLIRSSPPMPPPP